MIGAFLLSKTAPLDRERKIVGSAQERGRDRTLNFGSVQRLIGQRFSKLDRRARIHSNVAGERKKNLLVLVLGDKQCLLVIR
jgi:hypothetical protein